MAASLSDIALQPPQAEGDRPVNILLVDDQPGRLLTYRAILEPLGERLVEASSGTEALQRLMDEEFAVILLDVNMPGMLTSSRMTANSSSISRCSASVPELASTRRSPSGSRIAR